MTTNLQPGDRFVDIELLNHENELVKLCDFTQPSLMDCYMGFTDGYPLIVVFYRGFFCPRDQEQLSQLSRWAWKKPTMLRYINTENVSTEVTEIWVPV